MFLFFFLFFFPELKNSPRYQPFENLIWQQDGAPPHYAIIVRSILNDSFNEWIGRRGTWDWPPRSCDLTCMDFGVWGIIKEMVYRATPRNVDHLKELIVKAFDQFAEDKELIKRICLSVSERCDLCIEANGAHFEHLKV